MNEMYTPDSWGRKMHGEPAYYNTDVSDKVVVKKTQDPERTSTIARDIGTYYRVHGCDNCYFYETSPRCDTNPENCYWIKMHCFSEEFEDDERMEQNNNVATEKKADAVLKALYKLRDDIADLRESINRIQAQYSSKRSDCDVRNRQDY